MQLDCTSPQRPLVSPATWADVEPALRARVRRDAVDRALRRGPLPEHAQCSSGAAASSATAPAPAAGVGVSPAALPNPAYLVVSNDAVNASGAVSEIASRVDGAIFNQPTAANRFVYNTTIIPGRVLCERPSSSVNYSLSRTDTAMVAALFNGVSDQDRTFICYVRKASTSIGTGVDWRIGGNPQLWLIQYGASGWTLSTTDSAGNTLYNVAGTRATDTFQTLGSTWKASTDTHSFYVNGVLLGNASGGTTRIPAPSAAQSVIRLATNVATDQDLAYYGAWAANQYAYTAQDHADVHAWMANEFS